MNRLVRKEPRVNWRVGFYVSLLPGVSAGTCGDQSEKDNVVVVVIVVQDLEFKV